ncbi:tocopherol cyclase family protein [Parvicella tangerina]|uniref:AttH domain-containing protein n=1 Tax=Parvicella tangerina TaxID=2829795 RepID=A0A916ND93_9FLAO|nr:tocopherol cyclase family protein [Parvicella tangerina]CAG5084876.1 hypothetical protein CRYO30217_02589 [Parvicella tangerina]
MKLQILPLIFIIFFYHQGYLTQASKKGVEYTFGEKPPGYKRQSRKNPEMFQGFKEKKNYFEGWYFKMVSGDRNSVVSVIPGISLSEDGSEQHAFIQIINGKTAQTYYYRFDISAFHFSSEDFSVRIGENHFSSEGISLNIQNDTTSISGEIKNHHCTPLNDQRSIMGWYYKVPFMQCYHGVVSLDHDIQGSLKINDNSFSFDNGKGYIEKDWGESMPSSWIWMQSNNFNTPNTSFMLSIANIPWLGKEFTGFLGFILLDGRVETFGTYSKSDLKIQENKDTIAVTITTKNRILKIAATRSEAGMLAAPVKGSMDRRIAESINAQLNITVYDLNNTVLFRDSSNTSGLEVVGNLSELKKIK